MAVLTLDDLISGPHGPNQRPKYGNSPNIHIDPWVPPQVDPNAIEMDDMGWLEQLMYLLMGYKDIQ